MSNSIDDDMPSFAPAIPPPAKGSVLGDNKAPTVFEFARDAYQALNKWLDDHPVIQTEIDASDGKLYLDRTKAALADVETAKTKESGPLYTAWKDCLARYAKPAESLTKLIDDLRKRLTAFALAEEAKRKKEAEEAAARLAEAERLAHEAAAKEAEAKANAEVGEIGADVGGAIAAADDAFEGYLAAKADAKAAEKATHVQIEGGFARNAGLRTKTILVLDDAAKAIAVLGITDDIREAILKSARAYKALNKKLPDGVSETKERSI